ncbi:hypothetical protein EON64_20255 [archaeon]|nr:MAG: hypothetical protein EON64_20255 [archaeon]
MVGEGNTARIFRIDTSKLPAQPDEAVKAYTWIGLAEPAEYNSLVKMVQEGQVRGELLSALDQLCTISKDGVTFGASLEHACNAIRITGALDKVYLGPSETYNNPCLVGEQAHAVVEVGLREIEIYTLP